MSHPEVHGVVVLARNGDRTEYYQDPVTYQYGPTFSTPLGEAQAHQVGTFLRNTYLNPSSPNHIRGISSDLAVLKELHVRVKVGGEGSSVFDSATATLQGLFPPNPNNKVTLANETTIVAPLGGYQYIPVETVEPNNDRSLEPWTDCPAFEKHVKEVLSSSEFKKKSEEAQPFFSHLKDFVFGRPTTLENAYNLFDYVSSELVHNKTYAHRLPPTFIEQIRGLADYRENAIFGSSDPNSIANIASRTALQGIVRALQRIAFNDDPLQMMIIESTYQPFISFLHHTEAVQKNPEFAAIPDFGSVLAIELRRGAPPESREFLRFKFRNGTNGYFDTFPVFNHHEDIPLTEFIYRVENSIIGNNRDWARTCNIGGGYSTNEGSWFNGVPTIGNGSNASRFFDATLGMAFIFALMLLAWFGSFAVKKFKRRNYIRLPGEENVQADARLATYQYRDDKGVVQLAA